MTTTYVGTNGPDTFNVAPSGNYIVTSGGGVDDIVLGALSGGLGSIVVTDFQAGLDGDRLDLLPFLQSLAPGSARSAGDPFAGAYLRLEQSGSDTLVEVNSTGGGVWSTLVDLRGVDANALTWANFPDIQPTSNTATGYPIALPTVTGGPSPIPSLVTGSSGDDVLVGATANDTFHGGGGSDRIFGSGGLETATYDGVLFNYALSAGLASQVTGPGYIYQVAGGPEGGTDTLVDIQRIQFLDGYMATSPTDTAGQVYRIYEATLGRAPDQEGLTNWVNSLNSGTSLQTVVSGFVNSTEFQSTYGSLDNTAFVTLLYNNVLHRAPDAGGLSNWVGYLNSGQDTRAQVVLGFSESQEHIADLAAPVQQGLWVGNADAAETARLYDTVLGRLPDLPGLTNWVNSLEAGMSLQSVANGFVGSQEFQTTYGALNNTDFVTLLYANVLHRAPDTSGLNNWVSMLGTGQETRAQVVVGFSESPEHMANTAAHIDSGIWVAG